MTLMRTIAAPASAPQTPPALPQESQVPVLDLFDKRLLEIIGEHDMLENTALLNFVTNEQAPKDRSEERRLWLAAWHRLQYLLRLRLVFRAKRKCVTTQMPVPTILRTPVEPRRLRPTVWKTSREYSASTHEQFADVAIGSLHQEAGIQVTEARLPPQATTQPPPKTECAPALEQVTAAAGNLAMRPRRVKRDWTGWLNPKERLWRNRRIELPDGSPAFVFGALRGRVIWKSSTGTAVGDPDRVGVCWGVLPANEVRLRPDRNAQLLGAMKRGVREKPSLAKQRAARMNGLRPARPGSRPRGRPATAHLYTPRSAHP